MKYLLYSMIKKEWPKTCNGTLHIVHPLLRSKVAIVVLLAHTQQCQFPIQMRRHKISRIEILKLKLDERGRKRVIVICKLLHVCSPLTGYLLPIPFKSFRLCSYFMTNLMLTLTGSNVNRFSLCFRGSLFAFYVSFHFLLLS